MFSFLLGLSPLRKLALSAFLTAGIVALVVWMHVRATNLAFDRGYQKRLVDEQAIALDVARDAAKATARLRDDKQQLDANYEQLQTDFKHAMARSNTDAVRMRSTIAASRLTASAPGAASAECRAASQRDGELLADMEQAGRGMATEAQRLAHKVSGLQAEVQFYYAAANDAGATQ